MEPERISDRCIKLGETIIPAMNIQVGEDGVPGYLRHEDGTIAWYGIYFEIMFEDGTSWEVCQGEEGDFQNRISVWQCDGIDNPVKTNSFIAKDWETFLDFFALKNRVNFRLDNALFIGFDRRSRKIHTV